LIAIIDYKAGNLTSVKLAFDAIGVEAKITDSPQDILAAERVVFPGVGAACSAMTTLKNGGLADVIRKVVVKGTPFLGICLGCQVILEKSEEGNTDCLGLLPGTVNLFRPSSRFDKVPQMGWNSVEFAKKHPIFDGIESGSEFYFVHSYYPAPSDKATALGTTEYAGVKFASVIGRGNIVATQFHPEKSGRVGLRLLENFGRW
jgi:imidazole glycerol-phosphate synthase subunit HisH